MIPFIIAGASLVVAVVSLEETKKSNNIALFGILVGLISTVIVIWAFLPKNEETFHVVNYYEDGTLHYTGNGTYEDREDTWRWYSKDGILIKLENYDDNELNGEYKEFYFNGNIKSQGFYDNGERELDTWKFFNIDGSQQNRTLNIENDSYPFYMYILFLFKYLAIGFGILIFIGFFIDD